MGHHTGYCSAFTDETLDGLVAEHVAAVFLDNVYQRVDDAFEVVLGVIRPPHVTVEKNQPAVKREIPGRQQEIGPLAGEQALCGQRQGECVEYLLQGLAVILQQLDAFEILNGAADRPRLVERRHAPDQVGQVLDFIQEATDLPLVPGKKLEEPLGEQIVIGWNVQRVAGDPHVIETVFVQGHERYAIFDVELCENAVHEFALAAIPYVVELGIEAIFEMLAFLRKRVPVAAGEFVGFQHKHLSARLRHQGAE